MKDFEKELFILWQQELKEKEHFLLLLERTDNVTLLEIQNLLTRIISFTEEYENILSSIELRQLYLHKANIHLHFNEYSDALSFYKKAKERIPKEEIDNELHWLKCMEGISWIKGRMQLYTEALQDCNELIAYAYSKEVLLPKFFIVRACCYKGLENIVMAERDFDISNNSLLMYKILKQEGDEALKNGYTAAGYIGLGFRYYMHQQFDKALKMYEMAICLEPKNALAFCNKGVVLGKLEYSKAAIQAYSQCILLDPLYANAYLNRGNEYCRSGLVNLALQDYETCLKLDPENSMALDNIEEIKKCFR